MFLHTTFNFYLSTTLMPNKIISVAFLFFGLYMSKGLAQKNPVPVISITDTLIRSLESDRGVDAELIEFHENINHIKFDSSKNDIIIEFRAHKKNDVYIKGIGSVGRYDIDLNELIWERQVNFSNSFVNYTHNIVIQVGQLKSLATNLETNSKKWEAKSTLMSFKDNGNVVIGYDIKNKSRAKTLRAYDVYSGHELWTAQIDRRYGWRGWAELDEENVILAASGLASINETKGLNWKHDTQLVKKNSGPLRSPGLPFNQNSNVLIDNDEIYYATSGSIHRLDKNGEFIWDKPINMKDTGTSFLMAPTDSTLLFISSGYVYFRDNPYTAYGDTFLLLLSRKDGSVIWKKDIQKLRKVKLAWIKDLLYLSNKKKISVYNCHTGDHVGDVKMRDELTKLKGGIDARDSIYFYRNSTSRLELLTNDDPNHLWLLAKDFEAFKINSNGDKISYITPKDFFKIKIDKPSFKIVSSFNKSYVVRPDLTAVLQIDGGQATIFNEHIYFSKDNALIRVPYDTIVSSL